MKFIIRAFKDTSDGDIPVSYLYDNMTNQLWDQDLNPVQVTGNFPRDYTHTPPAPVTSKDDPLGKVNKIKKLKIQLGLSCNYSCEYCSQRFVPNIDHANSKLIDKFVSNLDNWLEGAPEEIEFWGGEPLVYWKTLKPLAEALAEKYLFSRLKMVTNGSLLTDEIVDWLDELDFSVGISHDGPGQNVRGPDPLEDPAKKEMILKLFHKLNKRKRISFNSMIHRENLDRAAIQRWFEHMLGKETTFVIGEGGFIDVYDEGGMKNSLQDDQEHYAHRVTSYRQLYNQEVTRFDVAAKRIVGWVESWANQKPAYVEGQKCGMDAPDTIAVDLMGNVLTCQNVTAVSKAPNGNSHRIGHVNNLEKVQLNTATHWSKRKECMECPLLQSCKGSCMFLEGKYFKVSCDNAYSDHLPFFAVAFNIATGAMPVYIEPVEGDLPEIRKDLWGSVRDFTLPATRNDAVELNGKVKITQDEGA